MAFLPKRKVKKAKRGGETTPLSSVKTTPQRGGETTLKYTIPTHKDQQHKTPRKRGVVRASKNQEVDTSDANAEDRPETTNAEGVGRGVAEAIAAGQSITDDRLHKRAERLVSAAQKGCASSGA